MPSSASVVESPAAVVTGAVGAPALLDIDKIRQLVEIMVANDLVEISLRDGDVEISLRRPTSGEGESAPPPVVSAVPAAPDPGAGAVGSMEAPPSPPEEQSVEFVDIKSPMVGTFYAGPDPDSPPFVDVGAHVTPETLVCILEAMKVFNEIKAEVSGTIERVLVKNEQPVEYGQPLFLVRPD